MPLVIVVIYAFSEARTFEWPPPGFTLEWFEKAIDNVGARDALWYSVKVGLLATGVAMILGTLASLAVARHRFFGRETISFLVILPIALPGHRHRHRAELDLHRRCSGSRSAFSRS